VLLPGDPGRALAMATALLDKPLMFNHHRGLWGYTGRAADGELLTIQATGMGGPSAAIVLEELCDMGIEAAIRVGTCGALAAGVALGDLVAVRAALGDDGASRMLGAPAEVPADAALATALAREADHEGLVACTDLFYDPDATRADGWRAAGVLAVEMESAAVLAVASRRGIRAGAVLAVVAVAEGDVRRLDTDGIEAAGLALGRAATAALGIPAAEVA
jgi:uridine phosphorylase